jgi:hypothetical protein
MNHETSAIHVQHAFYTPTTLSLGAKRIDKTRFKPVSRNSPRVSGLCA